MSQNNYLAKCGTGLEGIAQIYSDTLHATQNVYLKELRPKWLDEAV
jgi:hypothetical protein